MHTDKGFHLHKFDDGCETGERGSRGMFHSVNFDGHSWLPLTYGALSSTQHSPP